MMRTQATQSSNTSKSVDNLVGYVMNSCIEYAWEVKRKKVYDMIKKTFPYKAVLDAGCGDYNQLRNYLAFNKEAFGVGIDVKSTDDTVQSNIDGIAADVRRLPIRNNSFDLIVSTEVIEHLYRGEEFLEEAHRVLKEGGHLVLSTPNYLRWSAFVNRLTNRFRREKKFGSRDHVHEYNQFEIKNILYKVGFDVTEISYGALNPYLPPFKCSSTDVVFKIYTLLDSFFNRWIFCPLFKWDFVITAKKRKK